MHIENFKEGDLITRVETVKGNDSYIGKRLLFIGRDKKLIFLMDVDLRKRVILFEGTWAEGWDLYPQQLLEKSDAVLANLRKPFTI